MTIDLSSHHLFSLIGSQGKEKKSIYDHCLSYLIVLFFFLFHSVSLKIRENDDGKDDDVIIIPYKKTL